MTCNSLRGRALAAAFTLALVTLAIAPEAALTESSNGSGHTGFGTYSNDETAVWDGWNRTSQFVPAEDGTRLAVDVYLPTKQGNEPVSEIPVVLHYTRYIRASETEDGSVRSQVDRDPILQHLLKHGYAVAVADARGTGASFGIHHGAFSVEETKDSYTIIEWLGSRPWSNGKVGMSGRSYPGMTQYQAATQNPPSLKAIFAEMAGPSAYDFIYRGGAFKKDFIDAWGSGTREMDEGKSGSPARVDADIDGTMRSAALEEHNANLWAQQLIRPGSNLRNFAFNTEAGGHWSWDRVIASIDDADAIAQSGIGIYHLVGWYDIYTTQQPWLYATLAGRSPQKMMIGPWVHSGGYGGRVHKAEILRWYDHWLKGIDNGVMDEKPVNYYLMRGNHSLPEGATAAESTFDETAAEEGSAWTATDIWPPKSTRQKFWLAGGTSGTVESINDGMLVDTQPADKDSDDYTVDYSSRVGAFSRWMNGYGATREEPAGSSNFDERTAEDEKALTYTSEPLGKDLTLIGYPTAHLRVTSTHTDGDFIVYLEEIDKSGRAHYITEGVLRASHRVTSEAPFDNFDLPYHRSYAEDLAPMKPGEATELVFDLMGTAIVLDAGHRIRITVTGADARNFEPHPDPLGEDAPDIQVLTGGALGSYVELPII